MWILILTITVASSGYGAPAASVSSVPGFVSESACMSAASAWLGQDVKNSRDTVKKALCAKA